MRYIIILQFILILYQETYSQRIAHTDMGLVTNIVEMFASEEGTTSDVKTDSIIYGGKQYELANHLGNVLATISDRRIQTATPVQGTSGIAADLVSVTDYYAFGMQMPRRSLSNVEYRFGFNGKENDNEVKGDGNQQDYGFRIYDTRLGKFLSVDPIANKYPWYTPYQFAGNKPITVVDLDGLEELENRELNKGKTEGQNEIKIKVSSEIIELPDGRYRQDVYKISTYHKPIPIQIEPRVKEDNLIINLPHKKKDDKTPDKEFKFELLPPDINVMHKIEEEEEPVIKVPDRLLPKKERKLVHLGRLHKGSDGKLTYVYPTKDDQQDSYTHISRKSERKLEIRKFIKSLKKH